MNYTKSILETFKMKKRIILIIFKFGLTFLILLTFFGCDQIFSFYDNIFGKPQYMEILVPEGSEKTNIQKNKPDSVLSAYFLNNDSIILVYDIKIVNTKFDDIDKYLNNKDFKYLFIKNNDNVEYKTIVNMLEKVNNAKIKKYALVDFNQAELDSILKIRK